METTYIPARNLVLEWDKTVRKRLFPSHFHGLFQPKSLLAPLETEKKLEQKRLEFKQATDTLVDKALACQSTPELEQMLLESEPMLMALYYDRVVFGTWFLDHMMPVRGNRGCEIPKDWGTFVSLLLHREWFV